MNYKIGDRVLVKAKTVMRYNDKKQRVPCKEELQPPINAYIIGAVRRYLGNYRSASYGYGSYENDYDPPYLEVTGSVILCRCRISMFSKEFDAHPDDVFLIPESPVDTPPVPQ